VSALLLVAGGVAAHPAHAYAWYRLYSDDDFHGFERTADVLSLDPTARVVVRDWQPALMLKTLAAPSQPWYSPGFYSDGAERSKVLSERHGPVYVVVDTYTTKDCKAGKCDASFLDSGGYSLVYQSSAGTFKLYEV